MSAGSDFDPTSDEPEPTRALLLAHALDACIDAERKVPGSADLLIGQQPAWARAELRRLVALAGSLDAAAASAVMSEDFRVAARRRLLRHAAGGEPAGRVPTGSIKTIPSRNGYHPVTARGHARWLWRGGAGGLLAATLVIAATLTASANALPGDPLYNIKQATEEVGLRLAPDDQARTLALLAQANARLDETARLLDEGRTDQAAQTTQRFDDTLDQATTTFVATISAAASDVSASSNVENQLSEQQQELQTLLQSAPEPAQADLRQALAATERSRARVADPKPVEVARREAPAPAAAAVPTVAPETAPTEVPEVSEPPALVGPSSPPPIDLVAQPTRETIEADEEPHGVAVQSVLSSAPVVVTRNASGGGRAQSTGVVTAQQSHEDEGQALSDQEDDTPPSQQVANPVVVSTSAHADDSHGQGDDGHARVAEQATPVPEARQGSQSSAQPSAPAAVVQAARSSSDSQTQSQSSHDSADERPQTATASTSKGSGSTSTASAPSTAHTATNTSTTNAHTSSSGGDSEHSSSASDGGHASTSSSSGDSGHSGHGH